MINSANSPMAIILDVIAGLIMAAAFSVGRKRGAIKMIWHALAWVVSFVLAAGLAAPFSNLIEHTEFVDNIKINMEERIENGIMERAAVTQDITPESISKSTGIPSILIPDSLDIQGQVQKSAQAAAQTISNTVVGTCAKTASGIILFVLLRVVMTVLYYVLNIASKLPVITNVNHMLGGLMGLIGVLFAIYLILAVIALFSTDVSLSGLIESSYIVKYFYNNNILLQLLRL